METKEFDAVELMRSIRAKLHEEYTRNPELRKARLKKIHKKYAKRFKTKEHA